MAENMSGRYCREIPVTFFYHGVQVNGFEKGFRRLLFSEEKDEKKITKKTVYLHLDSGTEWTVSRVRYIGYPEEEWSAEIYSARKTDVFENIGWTFSVPGKNGKLLGNYGDAVREYAEYSEDLTQSVVRHENTDGRPTHCFFPYYRLETDKEKTFAVVSWQGTWFAEFSQKSDCVEMRAGQSGVSAYLDTGERFRLPLVLFLEYGDDPVNVWRKFYINCNMPTVKGEQLRPMFGVSNGRCEGLNRSLVENIRETYDKNGIDYDFWWFDAGWGTDGISFGNATDQWYHGVNIEINREAFPDGLSAFGKELKKRGRGFMLWFEAELIRTPPDKWDSLFLHFNDLDRTWLLGPYQYEWCGLVLTAQMFDLGNDACRAWLENRVFGVMDEAGVSIYRQDFNIPPAEIWKKHDLPDRKGITENKYCSGYLKYLQDIRDRYGDILMDSCASGGGRCDLETMRLMVPLHFSDYQDVFPEDFNCNIYMQQVLWRWFPYMKNCLSPATLQSDYGARSAMNVCYLASIPADKLKNTDFARMKKYIEEWKSVNGAYLGNYYELERPSRNDEDLKAFMFFHEETQSGFVMVFAPEHCTRNEYRAVLRGLNPDLEYTVVNKDDGTERTVLGKELVQTGVALSVCPGLSRLLLLSARH